MNILSKALFVIMITINIANIVYCAPIHDAVTNDNIALVKSLLGKDPKLLNSLEQKWTPLNFAIASNHLTIVQYLLSQGATISNTDNVGKTPLFYAAALKKSDILLLLLNKGAQVNTKDLAGQTPIFDAATDENVSILIAKGADLSLHDTQGQSLLHALTGKYDITSKSLLPLLETAHLDINERDKNGKLPYFTRFGSTRSQR